MERRRRALTAGLIVGVSIHAMDAFAIQVALPALTADLHARSAYASVLTSYLLANVVGLVDGGRRCDARGLVHAQAIGLVAFAAGLVLAAVAPNLPTLLVGRVLQGYGGGALATVIYAAVQQAYARDERPMVLAWLSTAWGVGGAALPLPLGLLVDHVGWRAVFLVGLPGLLATWLLTRRALLEVPSSAATSAVPGSRGGELVVPTLGLVVGLALAIHAPSSPRWTSIALHGIGVLVAAACSVRIFPAGTFRMVPVRPASIFAKVLLCASYFGAEAFLPLALEELHGWTARDVSATLTLASITWSIGAFVQARALLRVGARPLGTAGLGLVVLGVVGLLPMLANGAGAATVFVAWALAPLGMGFAYTTVLDAAMADTPPGEEGATGTAVGLADSVGAALGTGLAGLLIVAGGGVARERLPGSLTLAWCGMALVGVVAMPAMLRLPNAKAAADALRTGHDDDPST